MDRNSHNTRLQVVQRESHRRGPWSKVQVLAGVTQEYFVQLVWQFCCDRRCMKSFLAKVRLRNVSPQLCSRQWSERLGTKKKKKKKPAQGFAFNILILKAYIHKDAIDTLR